MCCWSESDINITESLNLSPSRKECVQKLYKTPNTETSHMKTNTLVLKCLTLSDSLTFFNLRFRKTVLSEHDAIDSLQCLPLNHHFLDTAPGSQMEVQGLCGNESRYMCVRIFSVHMVTGMHLCLYLYLYMTV